MTEVKDREIGGEGVEGGFGEVPRYPFSKLDGTQGETLLSPSDQLAVANGLLKGQSLKDIADELTMPWKWVASFAKESGIFEREAEAMAELLTAQYMQLRQDQVAVAGDYVVKARALAAELYAVMQSVLERWRESPPKDMTATALARLIQQFRELQADWVQLVGVPAGVKRSEHHMQISGGDADEPKEITVGSLLDKGLSVEEIDGLIDIAERIQAGTPPDGGGHSKQLTAPGPAVDEGGPGVVVISEGA